MTLAIPQNSPATVAPSPWRLGGPMTLANCPFSGPLRVATDNAKTERKLQTVIEMLGLDLNGAIRACISLQHHRLTKSGGGDG